MKKITVAGLGYVGLSLAVLLSQTEKVTAVDIDKNKVDSVNRKVCPIKDKELEEYLKNKELNLYCTTDAGEAYDDADYIIIAVPTDYDEEKGSFDTSAIENVLDRITDKNACIIIKSTIPVGYTKKMQEKYDTKKILFSPEFLRESKALYDNLYPSRIIVSCQDETKIYAKDFAEMLKKNVLKKDVPVLFTGEKEAECIKLFSNSYLAMRVSFFNELDTYAEKKHLDSKSIIEGVCMDPRIGDHYNNPSFGYGGYCLPKDTKQLQKNYNGIPERMITAVVESNETRKEYIAEKVYEKLLQKTDKNPTLGIYRLAMKTGSDNFRNSSVLGIINRLKEKPINIVIYEPMISEDSFHGIPVTGDLSEFKDNVDFILANRPDENLLDVADKVYSRDLFGNN